MQRKRARPLPSPPQVFSLLNLIVERLGPDVKPFCPVILQLMPRVWEAAEGQSLLRIQVRAPAAAPAAPYLISRAPNARGSQLPPLLPSRRFARPALCAPPVHPGEVTPS